MHLPSEDISIVVSLPTTPMEFRPRDYISEHQSHALPRSRATHHPFSTSSALHDQAVTVVRDRENSNDFFDPLRGSSSTVDNSADVVTASPASHSSKIHTAQTPSKEWTSFKRFLMQKFPVSKMISVTAVAEVITKSGKGTVALKNVQVDEGDDLQRVYEEDAKLITRQEYVARLHELKDEIGCAWQAEDRVTAFNLSIKVVKLLSDTSVQQFYPTLFVLATEVMDVFGDMVWKRIKHKAEFSENGTFLHSLPENFKASDVCSDAKEICYNWFCKVGSIRELLPRIFLELAILPCWCFLLDQPMGNLQRLVMMIRGIADPVASAYCRLYMAHRAQKLPVTDRGYLVTCLNDTKTELTRLLSTKEASHGDFTSKHIISLMEPTIEYIIKCIFENAFKSELDTIIVELGLGTDQVDLFGSVPCVSVVLHQLLKELPTEVVSSNAVGIVRLIKCNNDHSFDQCLNYRLLGFRLSECRYRVDIVDLVVNEVIQAINEYDRLEDYLKVVDAYMDIILQNQMDNYLSDILEGLSKRAYNEEIVEDKLGSLQSIMMKLLSHFKDLDSVFALNHFLEILDVMYGSSRNVIDVQILNMVTRNRYLHDPSTIQLLFEIARSLYDGIEYRSMKDDDNQQPLRLVSRFIQMVDHGEEMERHLTFLVECRGAFGNIDELMESLVHSSNSLAVKALKDEKKHLTIVKACVAFSEVTIPSISALVRQLYLYLETAEVALLGGLVSHTDGLIVSAICCLENVDLADGPRTTIDSDGVLSSIQKLCSLLVMVPGNPDQGITKIPKCILSLIYSQSWMTLRMKMMILSAIVLSVAALSQSKLPYDVCNSEIMGNDLLFCGHSSYMHEIASLSQCILQNFVSFIEQEPSKASRGRLALEACNCIASSFNACHDVLQVCSKLMETARLCLSANDKYLLSTIKYLDKQLPTCMVVSSVAT